MEKETLIDCYLREAGEGAVIMAAPNEIDELRRNSAADQWKGQDSYRGARIELQPSWPWGWQVRRADGSLVEGCPGD